MAASESLIRIYMNSSFTESKRAYEYMKNMMFARKLVPSQKLIYRDLEKILKMSKTPIVIALSKLEEEGLVRQKRNRGYYMNTLNSQEVRNLYELRSRLEELCAEYAIQRYSANDLIKLKKSLDAYQSYENALYDVKRFKLDSAFHLQIAKMGKNKFLISHLQKLLDTAFILVDVAKLSPLVSQYKTDHMRIYEAIKSKDLNEAKKIIVRHERSCAQMF